MQTEAARMIEQILNLMLHYVLLLASRSLLPNTIGHHSRKLIANFD